MVGGPNEAVLEVFHTERTPVNVVEKIQELLQNPNDRYSVQRITKLVATATQYGYEDASDQ